MSNFFFGAVLISFAHLSGTGHFACRDLFYERYADGGTESIQYVGSGRSLLAPRSF